jgi:hypothetical protein
MYQPPNDDIRIAEMLADYVLACQCDTDADGIVDASDNCPDIANANQADQDNDGTGDKCDVEPYLLWQTQRSQGDPKVWTLMGDDLTFDDDNEAILWTTVDPGAPDDGLGWASRVGIEHSYVSYREVGQPDWSAETETAFASDPAGFWGPWNWVYPSLYIGANGSYEIKMSFEDAVGNLTEKVYTVEVVLP